MRGSTDIVTVEVVAALLNCSYKVIQILKLAIL